MSHLAPTCALIGLAFAFGCDRSREQAHDRVVDALNPRTVSVSPSQCAVIRLPSEYAALVFSSVGQTSSFKVFVSRSGHFAANQPAIAEYTFRESKIHIEDASIWVGYDGLYASAVRLDFEDLDTGISVSPFRSLEDLKLESLVCAKNRGLSRTDVFQSVGGR
jgi:hypothetical protein